MSPLSLKTQIDYVYHNFWSYFRNTFHLIPFLAPAGGFFFRDVTELRRLYCLIFAARKFPAGYVTTHYCLPFLAKGPNCPLRCRHPLNFVLILSPPIFLCCFGVSSNLIVRPAPSIMSPPNNSCSGNSLFRCYI